MVTKWGMSNEIGLATHDYNDGGRSMRSETRLLIEKEVKKLLERAYNNAKTILTTHNKELKALARALLEHETLTGNQVKALLEKVRSQQTIVESLGTSFPMQLLVLQLLPLSLLVQQLQPKLMKVLLLPQWDREWY
ncbi:hypothetical protein VNO78_00688 [Psophocarpus tetragonolobus]|uniref:Peptidase M41 domain-containing protein n=1 Tax=Psophocarpus tetragonolobus TaxID=3891 RepID=A0AAN9XTY8_PSOTE